MRPDEEETKCLGRKLKGSIYGQIGLVLSSKTFGEVASEVGLELPFNSGVFTFGPETGDVLEMQSSLKSGRILGHVVPAGSFVWTRRMNLGARVFKAVTATWSPFVASLHQIQPKVYTSMISATDVAEIADDVVEMADNVIEMYDNIPEMSHIVEKRHDNAEEKTTTSDDMKTLDIDTKLNNIMEMSNTIAEMLDHVMEIPDKDMEISDIDTTMSKVITNMPKHVPKVTKPVMSDRQSDLVYTEGLYLSLIHI